jgi:hypothetical protein
VLRAILAAAFLSASTASAASPRSPCSLATRVEVKAAFGGTVGAGAIDNSLPGAPKCQFEVKRSNLGMNGTAVVFFTPGQTADTFKLARKIVPDAVSVAGIATAAFYNPHTASIELLKRNTVATAQGVFLDPGGREPNARKIKTDVILLAKTVARHM